jgi:uncharacterized glyoxalase superfamily protein PhnB/predicted pyridoxine 5'-phosphate oxidase superfamily flavin-nucleotide-binding protein
MELSEDMQRVVLEQSLGFVATVTPAGKPNLSPKGTTTVLDAQHLMFADVASPGTMANLATNAEVEVNVVDPIVRKGYRFKGTATAYTNGDMFERGLAVLRERGSTTARERIRSIVVIEVTDSAALFSPAYDIGADEESLAARWLRHHAELHPRAGRLTGSSVAPVLGCQQVMAVAEWFRDVLGFELDPARVFAVDPREGASYAIVDRDGIEVHLQLRRVGGPHVSADPNAYEFYARVSDVDALHAELVGRGAKLVQPLEVQPYGMRDFSVESPEGHRLMFGAPVE